MGTSDSRNPDPAKGLITGLLAFLSWGLVPIYWKQLAAIPALHILAHRGLWSLVFLAGLLTWQRRWSDLATALSSPRQRANSAAGALAITANWFIFIWAVNAGHVIETSLGYFLTPLVNVLIGALVLRERLSRLQIAAVALAAFGVLNLVLRQGSIPWVAIGLCTSFGLYGLLRKKSGLESVPGLFIETALMAPFAVGYILWTLSHDAELLMTVTTVRFAALLLAGGLVTALPLIWFAHSARNLPLNTVAILQYLAPTVSFVLGVFLYHEPFTTPHAVTFALIWTGIALYLLEMRLRSISAKS